MIGRIVDFALKRRAVILVAAAVLVLLGIQAFRELPIEAYPDVGDPWVLVITQWAGHAPEEVERQLTIPIEREMGSVPKKTAIRSVSIAGLSVVTIIFEESTDNAFARQQVLEHLSGIDLPEGVKPELGPLASPVGEIMRYRLVSCAKTRAPECTDEDVKVPPLPLSEMKDLQDWVVSRELLGVSGVADVSTFGGTTKQYQVLVDPLAVASHGLTLQDIEDGIEHANGNAGGGAIQLGAAALNIRGIGLLKPSEIADVAVAVSKDGVPVRVRQIGRAEIGHKVRLGRVAVDDDSDVVAATVLMRKGEQAQLVLERLHERIAEVNARVLPVGTKISPYHDRTELMKLTTHTVMENLLVGLALVAVVLFFFLGNARAALIVAITIPLALLGAFFGMQGMRIPANLLSIGAVDFGMIVEGSIIMTENIFRIVMEKQEKGEPYDLRKVVRTASREVARPVVFAIAIIVVAYLPIFTLQRVEGRLFAPMAYTMAFLLLGALVLSITVVPVLTTFAFRGKLREWKNPVLEYLRELYRNALGKTLARPKPVVLLALILIAIDGLLVKNIGSEFLPHLDEGAIWMRATLPANISLEGAEAIVDGVHKEGYDAPGIREILGKYPEVRTMAAQIGRPDDAIDPTGFYNAEFLLVLRDRSEWRPEFRGDKERLIAAMDRDLSVIPGVQFGFSQPISDNVEEAMSGVKGQLAVKIVGENLEALEDIANRIAGTIQGIVGVVDLKIIRELGQSNVHVEIARERAERYGLSIADVEAAIERGVGGHAVTDIIEGERRHELVVRYAETVRDNVDRLRQLTVPVSGGKVVPLSEVADVRVAAGASRIFREHGKRYIALAFGIRGRDLGSTVAEAQRRVAKEVRVPAGYTVTWEGEFDSARRAGARLAIVIPVTLIAIFVLLFVMFKKGREAAIVMLNVLVTSPVGGLAALMLTHTNFSVSSGVGFLALFGVSVQTGVILIADMMERRKTSAVDDAIVTAAVLRFRPISMTALVATLGLIPAAVSHGIGSDSQKPLAIVVVGGLMSSLALSLFVLPVLYKIALTRSEKAPRSASYDEGGPPGALAEAP
jgi:cobalt-zinc-cadmium resistance protein CzcA